MSTPDPQVELTILTDQRYTTLNPADVYQQQIATEEGLLVDAFQARGVHVRRCAWDDPQVDWSRTRAALFRSTWDYVERIDAFRAWLAHAARTTTLINPPDLVQWNLDKRYLKALADAGVPTVPTVFIERGTTDTLTSMLASTGWDEVVIKPAISGAARLTWRANAASAAANDAARSDCVAREAMLIQAFESSILSHGETSVIVIDGQVTHAVRKTPRPGDFRVQDDHGGRVHPHQPTHDEGALARLAVDACPGAPVYARVDMVRAEGGLRVMELELIEPELFLRFQPSAADDLARATCRRLGLPSCLTRHPGR